ncbi:hypothetical protein [Paenibacillus sp. FSL H8-0537]|uniref:hypothetical protein n=1 Tax=Paenibacillus sp. FSL H8-0537 TaxID=2921399 RepID=UPI0031019179
MAKISKKNQHYRTKEEMANDIYNVLRVDTLSLAAKHAVIFQITWHWTEFFGKYTGCPCWSKKALVNINVPESTKSKLLRHDHVIPRKTILDHLFKHGGGMSRNEVYHFLDKNLVGCILLKEEDYVVSKQGKRQTMPDGWGFGDNIWERYISTDIEVFKVEWKGRNGTVQKEVNFRRD